MYHALTVNFNHKVYSTKIDEVIKSIVQITECTYLEIVNHAHDHYHVLIDSQKDLSDKKALGINFHIETIRNLKAYQKYMHNHDVVETSTWGELGYYEKPNDDDMIEYAVQHGPQKTVLKYGFKALKIYSQLKAFTNDINIERRNDLWHGLLIY